MRPESRREPSASFKRTVAQVRCCANAGFSEVKTSRSQEFRSSGGKCLWPGTDTGVESTGSRLEFFTHGNRRPILQLLNSCNSWLSAYTLILDVDAKGTHLPGSSRRRIIMARECSITGAKPAKGHIIHRRGMAKKKGGVGRHVTANTPRLFLPNLQTKRIWVAELNRFVTVKLTARALKTITKNGAFQTLKKAGLV